MRLLCQISLLQLNLLFQCNPVLKILSISLTLFVMPGTIILGYFQNTVATMLQFEVYARVLLFSDQSVHCTEVANFYYLLLVINSIKPKDHD